MALLTPNEETIRRFWIKIMVEDLGFPRALIAVEKQLSKLPHIRHLPLNSIPNRRIDIVVFSKENEALFPLLLIECKAVDLHPRFFNQALSYNQVVQAPFVALANQEKFLLGKFDSQSHLFSFQEGLNTYEQLVASLQK